MSNKIRKALCCTCGEIRTCHRPRNHQTENYWLSGPVDRNWHRELGDLKCSNCGQITRHAILHPEGCAFQDHAERVTRIALGDKDPYADKYTDTRDHIRKAYRQGRQANPLMNHLWPRSETTAARKAGKTTVVAYCGETVPLPEKVGNPSPQRGEVLLKPDPVRFDQEYEHPETGTWWIEMDCPDCYRVANERRMADRRKLLTEWLAWALRHHSERVPDERVEELIAAFKSAAGES
ncbi:hypothetical protein [Mycolicibacter minnesotensis]